MITTDAPGCRDSIIQNETGLLVPVRDIEALVQAIEKLVLDRPLRQKMGALGRKLAEQRYDVSDVVNSHLNIYRQLMLQA